MGLIRPYVARQVEEIRGQDQIAFAARPDCADRPGAFGAGQSPWNGFRDALGERRGNNGRVVMTSYNDLAITGGGIRGFYRSGVLLPFQDYLRVALGGRRVCAVGVWGSHGVVLSGGEGEGGYFQEVIWGGGGGARG